MDWFFQPIQHNLSDTMLTNPAQIQFDRININELDIKFLLYKFL